MLFAIHRPVRFVELPLEDEEHKAWLLCRAKAQAKIYLDGLAK
jgi:hypothetical protein